MLAEWRADIMCFSETWLNPLTAPDSLLHVHNYTFFRRDRPVRQGGGLLVYAKDGVYSYRCLDLEHLEIEIIVLEIQLHHLGSCLLFFAYRPPNTDSNFFCYCQNVQLKLLRSPFSFYWVT